MWLLVLQIKENDPVIYGPWTAVASAFSKFDSLTMICERAYIYEFLPCKRRYEVAFRQVEGVWV
jgi:hypothetical protein